MKHRLIQRNKVKARNTCLVKASDDWYPSFPDGTVEMTYRPKTKSISFWGDDDFGMQKDNSSEEEFKKLKNIIVSQEYLSKIGFYPCG